MKRLWSEIINGKTHEVFLNKDGKKVYQPPLPSEEVLKRTARDPLFAEELATGQVARCMTDDVAIGGMMTVSDMMNRNPQMTSRLCQLAESKGYKPKPTDVYLQSVAENEGDPQAFINHGQGRGHLQKVLESRGYQTKTNSTDESLVPVEKREPESDPFEKPVHKLHPRISRRLKERKMRENPEQNEAELDQSIIDNHSH